MANISDVYKIEFLASSEALAEALENYIKLADTDAYYNLACDLSRDGRSVTGSYASGRWVYSSNLEGAFGRPEEWLGAEAWNSAKPAFNKVLRLLKAGETIDVSYSEDEPGCQVFQDGYGEIGYNDETKSVYVSLDFAEHERPCDIVDAEDSDEENSEDKPYWCYAHEIFTSADDICEGAGAEVTA